MSATRSTFSTLSFVRLEEAVLCADCETISNSADHCLACGSRAIILLNRILGTLGGERAAVIPMASRAADAGDDGQSRQGKRARRAAQPAA
jgi:hypothetical protein